MRGELIRAAAAGATVIVLAGCGSSAKKAAAKESPTTTIATATTIAPTTTMATTSAAAPAKWTDPVLKIDGSSLGEVKVGMTFDQAQQAAGVKFDGSGDGAFYSTKIPSGDTHPFVNDDPETGRVFCVGAQSVGTKQSVVTPEGFHLGDTVTHLQSTYGARLVHIPDPIHGIDSRDGYVVTVPGGRLAFSVNNGIVYAISAGVTGFDHKPLTPSTCID
jgi:hypothetical protein